MVTPYSTPSIPFAPHATPLTANQNFRPARPPIHNPYDKFTQPDFDAWIGDITSALRKALGQESDLQGSGQAQSDATRTVEGDESGEEDDEALEDSFAEVKARRLKGKSRDPREGPGLGGRLQPIEIQSDSESDQEVDDNSEYEDERYNWSEDSEEDDAPAEFEASRDDSDVVEIPNGRVDSRGSSPSVVIELFSDGGEENEDGPHSQPGEHTEDVRDVEEPFEEHFNEECDGELGQVEREAAHVTTTVADEKYRLNMAKFGFPEPEVQREAHSPDVYAESPTIDPEVDDFPPFHETPQPLDLPDPWAGPQTYAEDFYSGGDIQEDGLRSSSPSHLTPARNDIVGMVLTPGILTPREKIKNMREEEDVLPNSSPLAPSPVEELFEDIDAPEHMPDGWYSDLSIQATQNGDIAQDTTSTVEANGQVGWNWPPAFSVGQVASRPRHLATSPVRDQEGEGEFIDAVEDEEEGDDLDEDIYGAAPLGTSDLVEHKYEHEGRGDEESGDVEVIDGVDVAEAEPSQSLVDIPPQDHAHLQDESIVIMQGLHEPASLEAVDGVNDIADDATSGLEPPADFGVLPTASSVDSVPLAGKEEMSLLLSSFLAGEDEQFPDISDVECFTQEIERKIGGEGVGMSNEETAGKASEEKMGYPVIEIESDDEHDFINDDKGIIVSVSTVEKPVTEGRRREEPHLRAPSVGDSLDAQLDSHVPASETLSVDVFPIDEGEGRIESAALSGEDFTFIVEAPFYEREPSEGADHEPATQPIIVNHSPGSNPDNAPLPSSIGSDAAMDVDDVSMRDEVANEDSTGTIVVPQQIGASHDQPGSDSEVQTETPMPVSADPTVPDCTIIPISPTPHSVEHISSPSSISSPVNGTEEPMPASVPVLSSTLKTFQQSASSNGLFTPTNETDSGPGTPSNAEGEIGVVNRDKMAQIEDEVLSDHQQIDPIDQSPILDLKPGTTETLTNFEFTPTDQLTSVAVEPFEHAEFAIPSYQATDSTEPNLHHNSIYLTMPQPTEPILYADPYPYSLSTPGSELHDSLRQVVLGQDLDVMSEEEREHSSPYSSDEEDKEVGPDNEINSEGGDLELLYPSELEHKADAPSSVGYDDQPDQMQESNPGPEPTGAIDAVSGMEADSVPILEPHSSEQRQLDSSHTIANGDPFKLMGDDKLALPADDSKVAPLAIEEDASTDKDAGSPNGVQSSDGSPLEGSLASKQDESYDDDASAITPETESPIGPVVPATTIAVTEPTNGQFEIKEDVKVSPPVSESSSTRPSKRRRKSQVHIPPLITRSKSAASLSAKRKGKGKRKEKGGKKHRDDAATENGSTSSGVSTASRMLRAPSGYTSRASSTFSTAPSSNSSFVTQFSPALDRQRNNPQTPPAPLFHTHGAGHAHQSTQHHRLPLSHTVEEERPQKTIARVKDVSKEPGPSQHVSPQARPASSPLVTRSQCRFHKISLPGKGGRRIHFVVPGCSLGDGELMTNEGIEDHGDATIEDSKRMMADIQSQDFSPDLVGNLRKLVGVDLLREQEVFYLPPRVARHPAKSPRYLSTQARLLTRASTDNIVVGSSPVSTTPPVSSISQASSSEVRPRHPVKSPRYLSTSSQGRLSSRASTDNVVAVSSPVSSLSLLSSISQASCSPSKSAGSPIRDSFSTVSYSDNGLSDGEVGAPDLKRRRKASLDVSGDVQSGEMGPPAGSAADSRTDPRKATLRNKQPSADAVLYRPPPDDGAEAEVDSMAGKSRNKRANKGLKRARTSEAAVDTLGVEARREKKRKLRVARTMGAEREHG